MKVKAIGFGISSEEKNMIDSMLTHVLGAEKIKITDVKSYDVVLTNKDIVVTYGNKAKVFVNRDKNKPSLLLHLPELSSLKIKGDKSRKQAMEDIIYFKEKIEIQERSSNIPTLSLEMVGSIEVKVKDGKQIIISDGKEISPDILTVEFKELLKLMSHSAFQEVKFEFNKNDIDNVNGRDN